MYQKSTIALPAATGMNAGGTDPQLVDNSALKAENIIYPRVGAIAKRFGTTQSDAGATNLGYAEFNGTGCSVNTIGVARLFNATSEAWNSSGSSMRGSMIETEVHPVYTPSGGAADFATSPEIAAATNWFGILYFGRIAGVGSSWCAFSVRRDNYLLNSSSFVTTGTETARIVRTGNGTVAVVYRNGGDLSVRRLGTDGLWSSAATTTLGTKIAASSVLDICPYDASTVVSPTDKIYIGYKANGTNQTTITVVDVVAGTESTTAYGSAVYTVPITICLANMDISGTGHVIATWGNATGVAAVKLDNTCTATHGAALSSAKANILTVSPLVKTSTSEVGIYVSVKASNVRNDVRLYVYDYTTNPATFTTSNAQTTRLGVITTKCWQNNTSTRGDFLIAHQGGGWWKSSISNIDLATTQRTLFVANTGLVSAALKTNMQCIGQIYPNMSGYHMAGNPAPSTTPQLTTRVAAVVDDTTNDAYAAVLKYNAPNDYTIAIAKLTSSARLPRLVSVEGGVLVPGSLPMIYDGQNLTPQTLLEWPEGVTCAVAAGASTWANTGVVGFRVIYEAVDNYGRIMQSIPSPPVSGTLTATTQTLTLTIPTMQAIGDYNNTTYSVRIVVYMTDIDGNVYYRTEVIANDTTADTVASTAYASTTNIFTTNSENVVAVTDVLYTNNGSLEISPAKPYKIHAIYQNRLFYVDSEKPSTRIWYTREISSSRGIPHSDFLYVDVTAEGGDITALVPTDEKLLIFKARSIFALHGQGPDDTGGGASYIRPRQVSLGVGMSSRKSWAKIPDGVLFNSNDGIQLLDRNEQVVPIGQSVKYYTDTYTIVSAATEPDKHIAIFASSNGPSLVYDYKYSLWAIWSGKFDSCLDVAYVGGKLFTFRNESSSDYAYRLNSSVWTDNSTAYTMNFESGWYNVDKLGEFRLDKIYLIGYNPVDSQVNIKYRYNYDPTWRDGRDSNQKKLNLSNIENFSYSDYLGSGLTGLYDDQACIVQCKGTKQRVKAVSLAIYDSAPPGGTQGRGFEVTSIVLAVRQPFRDSAPARVGDSRKVT